jgi:O-methyltransferase
VTMKQMLLSLARQAGFEVTRIGSTWRGHPVSCAELQGFLPEDLLIARQVERYTATSLIRVITLIRAVRYVVRHQIPGAFVECGVWRGGSVMAIALTLLAEKATDRDLFLFDTFEGMAAPTDKDRTADGTRAEEMMSQTPRSQEGGIWCYAELDEVRANLATTGYPSNRLHFVKGRVEDTVPHPAIREIALVRLDTDWYESTRHELVHLYPLLSVGGVLILDDYGHWQGAKQATNEYIQEHPEFPIFLSPIDATGRLAIKVPTRPLGAA